MLRKHWQDLRATLSIHLGDLADWLRQPLDFITQQMVYEMEVERLRQEYERPIFTLRCRLNWWRISGSELADLILRDLDTHRREISELIEQRMEAERARNEARAERDRLRAGIEGAPHAPDCAAGLGGKLCACWKYAALIAEGTHAA